MACLGVATIFIYPQRWRRLPEKPLRRFVVAASFGTTRRTGWVVVSNWLDISRTIHLQVTYACADFCDCDVGLHARDVL